MPNCRSCHAEIIWLKHRYTGKMMPVDITKVVGGGIIADTVMETFRMASSEEMEKALLNRIPLLISHFATCKESGRFRKK